jgi:hypothetical protein
LWPFALELARETIKAEQRDADSRNGTEDVDLAFPFGSMG